MDPLKFLIKIGSQVEFEAKIGEFKCWRALLSSLH